MGREMIRWVQIYDAVSIHVKQHAIPAASEAPWSAQWRRMTPRNRGQGIACLDLSFTFAAAREMPIASQKILWYSISCN